MAGIGDFLGKAGGKLANGINTERRLKCLGKCEGRITLHIPISLRDVNYAEGMTYDNVGMEILSATLEYNPALTLIFGNSYACSECNKIRYYGGPQSDTRNDELSSVYL